MPLTRRSLLRSSAAVLAAPAFAAFDLKVLHAQEAASPSPDANWRHGLSLFGDPRYPAGFKNYDYVNASAPKGGTVRQISIGTFDSLNFVVAGVKGTVAESILLIYETLMTPSLDEVGASYGLIAESATYPADYSSATYRMNPKARWHDGKPITADDVVFSFKVMKERSPMRAAYYRHVLKAEKTGERDVTFTFDQPGNRELPQIVGELYVMPQHWWEGTDSAGRKRDISATTLEVPLGSGAYRITEMTPGRIVSYGRVDDHWAKQLNVNIGRNNFDELRFEYFRDATVALEAFKADRVDWRTENSAKNWATAYDFPALTEKRAVLEEFPVRDRGVMQAFIFNTRREKFSDPRVRLAFNYAFNFDLMNQQLFYGQYTRIKSYFDGTELASTGLPQGQELAFLEEVRNQVPPELFTKPYANPQNGDAGVERTNLRESLRLLKEAGYEIKDRKLVNVKTGEPFTADFLLVSPDFERVVLFYKPALERLGMEITVRTVDPSQYINRQRNREFDIISGGWGQSLSPGNEQRAYWSTQSADEPGSLNYAGIKNPAIDALIEKVIYAKDRDTLIAATKALDRVLLWNNYVVPQWTYNKERTARWDRFSHPEKMPEYGEAAFPGIWWWDADKAAKTGRRS